jgi:hypothetical protein
LPEAEERGFARYDEHWDSRIFQYRFGNKVAEQTIDNFLSVIDTILATTNLCFITAYDASDVLTVDLSDGGTS